MFLLVHHTLHLGEFRLQKYLQFLSSRPSLQEVTGNELFTTKVFSSWLTVSLSSCHRTPAAFFRFFWDLYVRLVLQCCVLSANSYSFLSPLPTPTPGLWTHKQKKWVVCDLFYLVNKLMFSLCKIFMLLRKSLAKNKIKCREQIWVFFYFNLITFFL